MSGYRRSNSLFQVVTAVDVGVVIELRLKFHHFCDPLTYAKLETIITFGS